MSAVLDSLRRMLGSGLTTNSNCCVALSGGLDSTVLLHGLCALRPEFPGIVIRAVHVDHGLHPSASDWAGHCRRLCRELDIPLHSERVAIDLGGSGMEAAARNARYSVFERLLVPGECLLTAHHQDDQLETFLLRMLRGAGPRGLAAIPERARFGAGWLIRPFLDVGRPALAGYAEIAGLDWLDDPSNTDTALDRNYLRHEVVPLLRARWPGVGKTAGRAARLSGEAADLLGALADLDCRDLEYDGTLDVPGLRALEPSRRSNVIRHILNRRGLDAPSEIQVQTGLDQLLSAKPDRQPVVRWGRIQARRYRDRLYFLDFDPIADSERLPGRFEWDGKGVIEMGAIRGSLRLVPDRQGRLALPTDAGVVVSFRRGGEKIREANQGHHAALKKLFQQHGVLPWMRCHVPLVYAGDRLLAVADLWVAAEAAAGSGRNPCRIVWENHAAIR
jgi:tRNA(Ile)-lysidine synthase